MRAGAGTVSAQAVVNSGVVVGTFEARRTRSSALRLVGLMMLFLVLAIAVLLSEDVLAGDGYRSINHRGTQLVVAWAALAIVARMLPMALLDLFDERPAICLDGRGGDVRAGVRRRRFRWEDVVAIQGGSKGFRIRLARGGSIRVAGEFEGHRVQDIGATALALWMSATRY